MNMADGSCSLPINGLPSPMLVAKLLFWVWDRLYNHSQALKPNFKFNHFWRTVSRNSSCLSTGVEASEFLHTVWNSNIPGENHNLRPTWRAHNKKKTSRKFSLHHEIQQLFLRNQATALPCMVLSGIDLVITALAHSMSSQFSSPSLIGRQRDSKADGMLCKTTSAVPARKASMDAGLAQSVRFLNQWQAECSNSITEIS